MSDGITKRLGFVEFWTQKHGGYPTSERENGWITVGALRDRYTTTIAEWLQHVADTSPLGPDQIIELSALKGSAKTLRALAKLETNIGRRVALNDQAKAAEAEFTAAFASITKSLT